MRARALLLSTAGFAGAVYVIGVYLQASELAGYGAAVTFLTLAGYSASTRGWLTAAAAVGLGIGAVVPFLPYEASSDLGWFSYGPAAGPEVREAAREATERSLTVLRWTAFGLLAAGACLLAAIGRLPRVRRDLPLALSVVPAVLLLSLPVSSLTVMADGDLVAMLAAATPSLLAAGMLLAVGVLATQRAGLAPLVAVGAFLAATTPLTFAAAAATTVSLRQFYDEGSERSASNVMVSVYSPGTDVFGALLTAAFVVGGGLAVLTLARRPAGPTGPASQSPA